jgi:hypothetical protein
MALGTVDRYHITYGVCTAASDIARPSNLKTYARRRKPVGQRVAHRRGSVVVVRGDPLPPAPSVDHSRFHAKRRSVHDETLTTNLSVEYRPTRPDWDTSAIPFLPSVHARRPSRRMHNRSSKARRTRCPCASAGSSGSASACVAAVRHCSSSRGYTPFSRHHALLLASSIVAVASTASNRAPPHASARASSSKNTQLVSNRFHRGAFGRQQPRYCLVLKCLSVSGHFVLPLSPHCFGFYPGDKYSDSGGMRPSAS